MPLSKERKVYLGVLSVAGLIAAIDFVWPEPDEATAGSARDETPESENASLSMDESSRTERHANHLDGVARKLDEVIERLRGSDAVRLDALAPSELWATPAQADHQPVGPTPFDLAQAFVERHSLSAVLESRSGAGAVVDGVFLKVGEALEEFELVAVGDRSAVFQSGQAVAILEIEQAGRRVTGPR